MMYRCEFCGAELPESASFCGACGRVGRSPGLRDAVNYPTQSNNVQVTRMQSTGGGMVDASDAATFISTPAHTPASWPGSPAKENPSFTPNPDMPTLPLGSIANEDEEEKRRRAALLGFGMPLLGSLGIQGQPQSAAPMVQGTPQMPGVPSVAGTPQTPGVPTVPGTPSAPQAPGSPAPNASNVLKLTTHKPHPPHHGGPHSPHGPHPHPHPRPPHRPPSPPGGCATWLIIAIMIPLVLIISFIGLGFTLWAPGISLSGGSVVTPGGSLIVHGHGFLPHSSVTLTLDGGTPLYSAQRTIPLQMAAHSNAAAITGITPLAQASGTSNVISAGGDGSFMTTIQINPGWSLGKHTIHAIESSSRRNASLDFTISQNAPLSQTTPSPSASATAITTGTPAPSATPTSSPTTTPAPGTASLSCVNPGTLNLGPVAEVSTQAVSGKVTLCAAGTGTVNWSATWNAASWLQLDHTTGQLSAPGQAQVTVSASAANLNAGTYNATITFSALPGNSTQTLNVSFTVSATPPCVTASSASLNFSGVANVSDPPGAQTLTITNCGKTTGTWSATIAPGSGGNWLSVNPASNSLAAGASTTITVAASNLKAGLGAGTYSHTLSIRIGTSASSVSVTLTVQPAPVLSVTPTSINADQQCSFTNSWICYVDVTNTSQTLNLTWSAASSGISGIGVKPMGSSGFTLPPGQTERVQITVPSNDCSVTATITFSGPADSVGVSWNCTIIG